MELHEFLRSLKRYKAILFLVPAITLIAAFIIVRQLPDKYTSYARLAATAADKSQQLVNDNQQSDMRIHEEFDNLLQTLTLNKIIDRVSYKLMLHDLQNKPFRKPSNLLSALNPEQKQNLTKKIADFYDEDKPLNYLNGDEKSTYKLLKSLKYDDEYLKKHIAAYHVDNSEYINLEFASENPQLSAFVLNTLSGEFINYYTSVFSANRSRSVQFLDSLMLEKQKVLAEQMEMLKKYKIDNGILNVDDEAKTIYGQLADMEAKKTNAEKDMVAYSVALSNINSRFSPDNRKFLESSVSGINSQIINTKDQISSLNDAYIQSGFDEKYKTKIDTLQKKLTHQIYDQSDNYAYNPSSTKDNLVAQKLNLEISKDLAQNSVQSLNNEIGKLNGNLQKLVPNLATIQSYQAKIEVANKEYLDVLQKYNQASLEASYNVPVRLVEKAMPGDAAPNKKILLVGLSGVTSFILCLLVLFVMFYFDHTIHTPEQLKSSLDIPVIGSLNSINSQFLNLQDLWDGKTTDTSKQLFKNSLRSIRHEIENDLQDGNVLAVTSLNEGEGKTFLTLSLAYAFSTVNKKVLIIDGNFLHPDISDTIKGSNYIEKYLSDNGAFKSLNGSVNVIGNKGGDNSLMELGNAKDLKAFFATLRRVFDVILIETSALDSMSKAVAKEWICHADKVVVVFESGQKMDASLSGHVQYLKQLGNKLLGLVLNKLAPVPVPTSRNQYLTLKKIDRAPAVYETQ